MASITAIVLPDGQSTPVNKTFDPFTPGSGTSPAVWYEKSAGSLTGYRRITASLVINSNKTAKVRFVISDPILASLSSACCTDGMPVVAFTDLCTIEFSLPQASTVANRKDILAYAKNLLGLSVATDYVVNQTPVW